jgi:hypothetical protein
MAGKASYEFFFSEGVTLRTSFNVHFIRPKESSPKGI